MFGNDDYSLPANYGYGDGDASQLAGLAGSGNAPSYASAQPTVQTIPERPKMRVVPNPGERGYADATSVAVGTVTDEYGYGATKSAAQMAAEQAATMPTVTDKSPAAEIGRLQDALNAYVDRSKGVSGLTKCKKTMVFDAQTISALNAVQIANGMPAVPQATPRVWSILFGDARGAEFDKLQRKEGLISGIEAGAEGVLSILQQRFMPSAVSNAAPAGQQVSGGGEQQQGGGTDWTTYLLIAGGVLLVGGAVYYFSTRKED